MLRIVFALALAALAAAPAHARRHHIASPASTPSFLERLFSPHATPSPVRPFHHRGARVVGDRGTVRGGRPAQCHGIPWCGCWLRLHLGINDVRLNLARAWASIGTRANGPAAGVIAVWPHHVGIITGVGANGSIILLSGNDGHAVRERPRSTAGIIAYRSI